jgi:hypothetical protein
VVGGRGAACWVRAAIALAAIVCAVGPFFVFVRVVVCVAGAGGTRWLTEDGADAESCASAGAF